MYAKRLLITFIMLIVLFLLVACASGEPEPVAPETIDQVSEPIPLPDTPTAVSEIRPTPTAEQDPTAVVITEPEPEPEPTLPTPNVTEESFNGVSFFYDQNIIQNITPRLLPAFAGAYGMPPDGPILYFYDVPDFIRFDLDLGDQPTVWPSQLALQPYQTSDGNTFAGYNDWDYERDRLNNFAAQPDQPATAIGPDNDLLHVQPLNFSNGRGVRYIAILPPGPGLPTVSNDQLFYIYNGLTEDNRYYIYLQFALTHPDLPNIADINLDNLDIALDSDEGYEAYLATYVEPFHEILREAAPSDLTPNLTQLDNMVATLFVPAEASTISSIPTVDLSSCEPNASFVEDVTIPDGSPIEPNTVFTKTWRIRNSGSCPITAAFEFYSVGGNEIRPDSYNVNPPLTMPGETFDISVPLISPPLAGYYRSEWQFQPPFDLQTYDPVEPFGPRFYTEITVNRNAEVQLPTAVSWDIFTHYASPIAALSEAEATARYGTPITITADSITFGDQTCTDLTYSGEYLLAGNYFDTFYQFSSQTIYIEPQTPIAIIRTNCDIPGFGEFISLDQGYEQLFINQDGVFYPLYPRGQ